MTGPPPEPPTPGPRAVLRYGSWEEMHASGLTWEQLHLSGLTWEGLIWMPEPAPEYVSPSRVGLNGARRSAMAPSPDAGATAVVLNGSRRSLAQTGPPGGRQHGRPGV